LRKWFYELKLRNLKVEHEKSLPIFYKNVILECGYRLDLIVEDQVIVEVKSVKDLGPIHGGTVAFISENVKLQQRVVTEF